MTDHTAGDGKAMDAREKRAKRKGRTRESGAAGPGAEPRSGGKPGITRGRKQRKRASVDKASSRLFAAPLDGPVSDGRSDEIDIFPSPPNPRYRRR